jgi:hypothetical protein
LLEKPIHITERLLTHDPELTDKPVSNLMIGASVTQMLPNDRSGGIQAEDESLTDIDEYCAILTACRSYRFGNSHGWSVSV